MTNRVPIQQHADPTDHVLLPTISVACFERGQNPSVVFPSRRQLPVPPSHPLLGSSAPIPNYAVSPPTPAEHKHLRASFLATFSRPLESAPRRVLGNTVLERRSGTFAIPHLASSIPLEGHPLADDLSLCAAPDAPALPGTGISSAMREAQSPPEHPNTFDPSSSTPGRQKRLLLELLVGIIGKNARGQGPRHSDLMPRGTHTEAARRGCFCRPLGRSFAPCRFQTSSSNLAATMARSSSQIRVSARFPRVRSRGFRSMNQPPGGAA